MSSAGEMRVLRPGRILEIAEGAGLGFRRQGDKALLCCPFHEDRHASAFLSIDKNIFYCSVCTPGGGWPAKTFAQALGQPWGGEPRGDAWAPIRKATPARRPFLPVLAALAWSMSLARARDDDAVAADRPFYDYLACRGLITAWETGAFGILPERADLPEALGSWPRRSYRLVAPLFDAAGQVVGIQGRGLEGADPKTLFPAGSQVAGTVFADRRGHSLLTDDAAQGGVVVLGEGLTDLLALAIASPYPVLSAPGTSNARAAVGPWASGRRVIVALDNDEAGRRAVPLVAAALYEQGAEDVLGVSWPGGAKDACDVLAERGADGLGEFLLRMPDRRQS